MSASTTTQTIAFLGATGGCTLAVLDRALRAGHHARALARNPDKLRKLLIETRQVPESVVSGLLTIVPGSGSDVPAIRTLLSADEQGRVLVDAVVSGIGGYPITDWSNPLRPFTLEDPHVTETAARSVSTALRELLSQGYRAPAGRQQHQPLFVAISTTGVSRQKRDVPMLFLPLYHWAGAVMHKDKRAMEDVVVESKKEGIIRDFVIIRPSLLLDGQSKGVGAVKTGWEGADGEDQGQAPGPKIGYVITREDVGAWIWEEAILKENTWKGKCVSLTH